MQHKKQLCLNAVLPEIKLPTESIPFYEEFEKNPKTIYDGLTTFFSQFPHDPRWITVYYGLLFGNPSKLRVAIEKIDNDTLRYQWIMLVCRALHHTNIKWYFDGQLSSSLWVTDYQWQNVDACKDHNKFLLQLWSHTIINIHELFVTTMGSLLSYLLSTIFSISPMTDAEKTIILLEEISLIEHKPLIELACMEQLVHTSITLVKDAIERKKILFEINGMMTIFNREKRYFITRYLSVRKNHTALISPIFSLCDRFFELLNSRSVIHILYESAGLYAQTTSFIAELYDNDSDETSDFVSDISQPALVHTTTVAEQFEIDKRNFAEILRQCLQQFANWKQNSPTSVSYFLKKRFLLQELVIANFSDSQKDIIQNMNFWLVHVF